MSDRIECGLKSPESSLGYLMTQLTLLWQRKQKKVLDPLGLTHTQFILLASIAWLTNQGQEVTQVEIANLNNFDRMMVSKVLRTLQTKKLITRQEHNTDTRAKIVTLTPAGENVLQSAFTKIEVDDIDFFSAIGKNFDGFGSSLQPLFF